MTINHQYLNKAIEYDSLYQNYGEAELIKGKEIFDKTNLEIDPSDYMSKEDLTLLGFYIMYRKFEQTESFEVDPTFFDDTEEE